MENPFRRAFELQRRSSLKCPSCPTICQQNVKTSIQVTGICAECEKPQTKIKKTLNASFQQGNLCYSPTCSTNIFIFRNNQ
ncbi:hypothetical protein C1166_05955 [Enterobacter bugandensis]|uniref:Uncharacterized protein n=1 Tax=Enterobacter bugandensis TaxID=881260 RepID=A0ABX4VM06_9ENTR|nr:hypothetical protein B9Q19_19060 [Enterobacter bugandensis]PLA68615.1 hypothetical protein CYJ92_14495 [Enterobacter bugandensis]PLA87174.1 hypothetical protein CYK27_15695 [Enterobacter bugandensis]PNF45421.1 hypothetical protein C1166_05955 [Enterobacter bugandensis]PNF54899.1 hypothetical protein C1169_10405 [Enterobacter bugandensis]